jgi:hypothetical protein
MSVNSKPLRISTAELRCLLVLTAIVMAWFLGEVGSNLKMELIRSVLGSSDGYCACGSANTSSSLAWLFIFCLNWASTLNCCLAGSSVGTTLVMIYIDLPAVGLDPTAVSQFYLICWIP